MVHFHSSSISVLFFREKSGHDLVAVAVELLVSGFKPQLDFVRGVEGENPLVLTSYNKVYQVIQQGLTFSSDWRNLPTPSSRPRPCHDARTKQSSLAHVLGSARNDLILFCRTVLPP